MSYAAIALHNPKTPENVGGAYRAAHCYNAKLIVISGSRWKLRKLRKAPTDTCKSWTHIPNIEVENIFDALPYACVPIAVDLLDNACPLHQFTHPKQAFYVFGPEDGTLSKDIVNKCHYKIMIPTRNCMNLAAAVNVVLYDRLAKELKGVESYVNTRFNKFSRSASLSLQSQK